MKKHLVLPLSLALCGLLLTGCGGAPAGSVSTDGSTSMEKVIGTLGEVFTEDTGVSVTYNATGSSAGITAVGEGRCDIGLSSRALKSQELEKLEATVLAHDGIAIVVHSENPVADLTVEQLAQVFDGTVTDWSEVGGNPGEIVPIGREAGSGTRDGFESITDTEGVCAYRNELTSTGAVLEAVKANPNAVGYASLSSVKDDVKALTIDGVAPSEATIQDGSYAVQRDFVLVTRKGEALSQESQSFMDFMTGGAADELIAAAGAVPVAR